jgi:hypothetical protein
MAGSILISRRLASAPETAVHANGAETESAAQRDLWIFRDGQRLVSGPAMVQDLARRISACEDNGESLLDALIQAGQLEAALADANSSDAHVASQLTDTLGAAVCSGNASGTHASQLIAQIHPPDQISISPPEGFTYYALHPLDFARIIARIPDDPQACALIGIRSIGTTLSAVCAAALKDAGRAASRITVRPTGHPYSRQTEFTVQQIRWIDEQLATPAQFLIVDEGPGRSGSTFLSVAEALIRAGVPNARIIILGSRQPDPESLCANNAAARWKAFRFIPTTPSVNSRFEGCTYIGGGDWRSFMFSNVADWPESWTQMERLKFLSSDGKSFFKFEGMGSHGADVRERAFVLADAGLSPAVTDAGGGFLEYERLNGPVLRVQDISSSLLERVAQYCAFRISNFPAHNSGPAELGEMLEFNLRQEFGVEFAVPEGAFGACTPVYADGRMQPHEWVATSDGKFLKTDAISHGDDHFFPGACGIAWDLAGCAIEWQFDLRARDYLLSQFRRVTGTDISGQLPLHMLGYSVFRMGFCKMAISTVRGSTEESRLQAAYARYRALVKSLLEEFTLSTGRLTPAA